MKALKLIIDAIVDILVMFGTKNREYDKLSTLALNAELWENLRRYNNQININNNSIENDHTRQLEWRIENIRNLILDRFGIIIKYGDQIDHIEYARKVSYLMREAGKFGSDFVSYLCEYVEYELSRANIDNSSEYIEDMKLECRTFVSRERFLGSRYAELDDSYGGNYIWRRSIKYPFNFFDEETNKGMRRC